MERWWTDIVSAMNGDFSNRLQNMSKYDRKYVVRRLDFLILSMGSSRK